MFGGIVARNVRRKAAEVMRLGGMGLSTMANDDKIAQIERKMTENNIDTVIVGYSDIYGRLVGKRYDSSDFLQNVASKGSHGCIYTFAVDMAMNPLDGFKYANWETGFGDFHMDPDLDSFSLCGWNTGTAMVLCDVRDTETHELVPIAPRSVLRKQIERMNAAIGVGTINAASELEHYTYKDTFPEAFEKGYSNLEPTGYYSEDYHILQGHRTEHFHRKVRKALGASGIHVESSKGETGIGQHELNVQYAEALKMADRHVVFKQCMKEVAIDEGISVTFMAKPVHDDAGSSCHLHVSLYDKNGQNMFVGDDTLDTVTGCSDTFKHFLGGWINHTPELFALYAPTVNSYKRFCSGSWAPTATAWGKDNRTCGFRIIGSGPSLRIECRIPGGDVNPYLVFAAALASGLDGIENKISPPPIMEGDGYKGASDSVLLPRNLGEAASTFKDSKFAKTVFGEEMVEHYSHFYKLEQEAFDAAVTDWERKRYFEQI